MAKGIDDIVAENRARTDRNTTRFATVGADQSRGVYYGKTVIVVTVTTTVQKRASGTTNAWQDAGATQDSVAFAVGGREYAASSLDGGVPGLNQFVYGDGTTEADPRDDALGNQTGTVTIASTSTSGSTATITSSDVDPAPSFADATFEVGVEDSDGVLHSREVLSGASVDTANDEIRFVTDVDFDGDGAGTGTVTDAGNAAFADAYIATSSNVFQSFVFSDSQDSIDGSTTSLPNEIMRNSISEEVDGTARIVTSRVETGDTPDAEIPFDVVQGGIHDGGDELIFAANNRPIAVEDTTEFTAQATFAFT